MISRGFFSIIIFNAISPASSIYVIIILCLFPNVNIYCPNRKIMLDTDKTLIYDSITQTGTKYTRGETT